MDKQQLEQICAQVVISAKQAGTFIRDALGQVTDDDIQEKELQEKINMASDRLPEQCAKIFRMSRFENLKYQEIADGLGLSVKTVENQMGKALKLMRESLKDYITLLLILQIIS